MLGRAPSSLLKAFLRSAFLVWQELAEMLAEGAGGEIVVMGREALHNDH